MKATLKSPFVYVVLCVLIASCKNKKTELVWSKSIAVIGSQSSPRATDLNNDGTLDIVMGAGKDEYQESNFGVVAFDGKTGETLWTQASNDQIYGSATLLDIDSDGTKDVVIGGRSNNLMALNGKNGKIIWKWQYDEAKQKDSVLQFTKYNFHNSQVLPDQNGDKIEDLLVQCGGNPKAAPNTMKDRFPGVLMILNSKNANVIAAAPTPDGLESYTPPIYLKQPDGKEYVVFGTGGETISGTLYLTTLDALKKGNLKEAKPIASEKNHGFIAPPVAVDITNDGYLDFVAISHGSSIFAIDGKTLKPIWQNKVPDTESSNAFAVGNFTDDDTPDFFTFTSKGVWPDSKGSVQVMIDGKTGHIAYQNYLGCTGFSSPVIYDLNDDGTDEAIISINEYDCNRGFVDNSKLNVTNKLIAIDFAKKSIQEIDKAARFKNIFSTPYIGDLDADGYIDIVYNQYFNYGTDLMLFLGMTTKRISSSIKIKEPIKWGAYMGSDGTSVFRK